MIKTENAANTTTIKLDVDFGDVTYHPEFIIWDSGTWKLSNHEAMEAAMREHDKAFEGLDTFSDWLIDFWCSPDLGLSYTQPLGGSR
jgi:hypothetical protein